MITVLQADFFPPPNQGGHSHCMLSCLQGNYAILGYIYFVILPVPVQQRNHYEYAFQKASMWSMWVKLHGETFDSKEGVQVIHWTSALICPPPCVQLCLERHAQMRMRENFLVDMIQGAPSATGSIAWCVLKTFLWLAARCPHWSLSQCPHDVLRLRRALKSHRWRWHLHQHECQWGLEKGPTWVVMCGLHLDAA